MHAVVRYKIWKWSNSTRIKNTHPSKTCTNLNISVLYWLKRLKCSGSTETLKTLRDMEDVKTPRAQEDGAELKNKWQYINNMLIQITSNKSKDHVNLHTDTKLKTHAFTSAVSWEVLVRVRERSRSPACWISCRFRSTWGSSDTASVSAASCSACCRSSPKPSVSMCSSCVTWQQHKSMSTLHGDMHIIWNEHGSYHSNCNTSKYHLLQLFTLQ